MSGEIWGFIGVLVGAGVSIVTTALSNKNIRNMQSDANLHQREELSRAFQRDNLLEVQDTLQNLMRLAGQAFHQDLFAQENGTQWGKSLYSKDIDEGKLFQMQSIIKLNERIENEELRNNINNYRLKLIECEFATSEQESMQLLTETSDLYSELMGKVGNVLRGYY